MDFCESYSPHFIGWGMNSVGHARHYLTGLLGTQRRKNIEAIGQDVKDSDYQGMEQFISSSPWDHEAVMDQVARDANELLGDDGQAGLFIDESSFLKKGHASVGVQRQWSGRAGKLENCQVGVFCCLGRDDRVCLSDFRLFVPEAWAKDRARLKKAKVPQDHCRYRSKHDLALEMIRHAKELGLRFGWVGFDSLYGSKRKLVNAVEDEGLCFVGDVNKATKVWSAKPLLAVPSCKSPSGRQGGRPRMMYRLHKDNQADYRSVEALAGEFFDKQCKRVKYRQGTKGQLWCELWVRTVWTWEAGGEPARRRLLIIRRDSDGAFKYSLSNLPSGKQWTYYAWVQGQRFWVEHAFHQAKSQLGMAQYQVRVWRGWHHHMTLTAMALLFSQKLRSAAVESTPLLSVRDITELLDYYLPRKRTDEKAVLNAIRQRHSQRERDIQRRKRKRNGLYDLTK